MLQILRKKAQSPFIQAVVVIIALVFIFWGVGTNMGGSRQAAIVVNGEEISYQQYQQAYDRAFQQLSNQFGGNVPKGFAESFGLKQQVINQIVQTALLRQGAVKMGITISSEEIRNYIEGMVQFQENGVFSIERYKTVLAANRMAPTKFEQSMRFDHLSEVAAREIGRFGAIATEFEIKDIYSQLNEKIAVKYVRVAPANYTAKVTIDEATLSSWFETVKEKYKTEPQLKLRYMSFTFDEIGRKITIDNAKVVEYYQDNLKAYTTPEQRRARHILFKATEEDSAETHKASAEKAATVLKSIKEGASFTTLADLYAEGPAKGTGGDLGFFPAGRMVEAIDEVVFTMKPGQLSDVVKTRFGYHLLLLEEIKPTAIRDLVEVSSEITKTLQSKEAESLAFQVANEAYEKIIVTGSLAKYAEMKTSNVIHDTDFFTKSTSPAELKNDQQFLEKAFELNKGELSSLIKGQSGYAILFAEDRKEPEIPSFANVKETLDKDYRKQKAQELAETAAKELLTSIKAGKLIDDAATEAGLTVKESGLLGHNAPENKGDFPAALLPKAFLLSAASPVPQEPGKAGEDFYIFSFQDRQIPAIPENSDEVKKYRENLQRFKQQQLLSAWLRHLEINAKITKHQNL